MAPKEKANELVEKYISLYDYGSLPKQCALIAVNEILELDNFSIEGRDYWQEVKQEINNL